MSYREHLARYHATAAQCGLSYLQADSIRRDAQRLHTWYTRECNGDIQRFDAADAVTDHKGAHWSAHSQRAISTVPVLSGTSRRRIVRRVR